MSYCAIAHRNQHPAIVTPIIQSIGSISLAAIDTLSGMTSGAQRGYMHACVFTQWRQVVLRRRQARLHWRYG